MNVYLFAAVILLLPALCTALEAAERADFPVEDQFPMTEYACFGTNLDRAFLHDTAADFRTFRELKNLKDLCHSEFPFPFFRFKTSGQSIGNIFDQFVDDAVQADFHILFLRKSIDSRIDADVETDHNTV